MPDVAVTPTVAKATLAGTSVWPLLVTVNVKLVAPESPSAAVTSSIDSVGGAYDLRVECSGVSFVTPPGPLSDLLCNAVKAVTGLDPELSTTGGTSDARFIKNYCPVIEFGLPNPTMHKVDERVATADLVQLSQIYERMLDAYFHA